MDKSNRVSRYFFPLMSVTKDETTFYFFYLFLFGRKHKGWEKRYARLTPNTLYIYEQQPEENGVCASPLDCFDLKPADSHGKVIMEPLAAEIDVPVASSDLPFLVKIEVSPNTTCWPPKSFVFMLLTMQDKEKWCKGGFLCFVCLMNFCCKKYCFLVLRNHI